MKTITKSLVITLIIYLASTLNVKSQIEISNIDQIGRVKEGTTYIAMKDPELENVKDYIAIFNTYWTISKIKFIKYTDVEKYLLPENSFLTISAFRRNITMQSARSNGMMSNGLDYQITQIYLELWNCKNKFFEKGKKAKEFDDSYKNQIARIELFTDYNTLKHPEIILNLDYDGNRCIRNWGCGFLKNYIQLLMRLLNKNEEKKLYSDINNKAELINLKKEVLYIPAYILTKFDKFTGAENQYHDDKEMISKYKFKYEYIPTVDLNKKILSETSVFYYLIYIKSSTDKYISVVNSQTGEIIYSRYTSVSYNIKPKDFKFLSKKILSS